MMNTNMTLNQLADCDSHSDDEAEAFNDLVTTPPDINKKCYHQQKMYLTHTLMMVILC